MNKAFWSAYNWKNFFALYAGCYANPRERVSRERCFGVFRAGGVLAMVLNEVQRMNNIVALYKSLIEGENAPGMSVLFYFARNEMVWE